MVTTGTVEEKVIAMHKQKRFLAEDVLSGAGQKAITSEELLHLFDE
jgi:SNF2 family DNA or RNA helicase